MPILGMHEQTKLGSYSMGKLLKSKCGKEKEQEGAGQRAECG